MSANDKAERRDLIKKHHPDRGGSSEKLKDVLKTFNEPKQESSTNLKPGIVSGSDLKNAIPGTIRVGSFDPLCVTPLGYEVHLHRYFGVPTVSAYAELDSHKWIKSSGYTERLLPQAMTKHVGYLFSLKEVIGLPDDIYADFTPKSTWSRVGMLMNHFTIEPGYSGAITFTITSSTHNWRFYPDDAIGTLRFYKLPSAVKPYKGRYQDSGFLSGPLFD